MNIGSNVRKNGQRKEKDHEELVLFRELHKRRNNIAVSLLQPVSDEFDPHPHHPAAPGNYPIYRIPSAKKGAGSFEFLADNGKNDYDWLKTPPATPLFPSLEMEATAPQLAIQKDLHVNLLRITNQNQLEAGNLEAPKAISNNGKPNPKVPLRSTTPSQRRNISSIQSTKTTKGTPIINQKLGTTDISKRTNASTNTTSKSTNQNLNKDFLTSNLSKNIGIPDHSKTKPRSRCVSPLVRSTIPAQIPDFSNETPPNLRTDRSTSATRGRPVIYPTIISVQQKPEASPKPRRQSCSPSVMRGRKVESKQENTQGNNTTMTTQKAGRIRTENNGTNVLGSRMVEKMMNARKSGVDQERESKPKLRGFINESSGYGRMMSKSSLDMALKQMEIKRDRINSSHIGIVPGRRSS